MLSIQREKTIQDLLAEKGAIKVSHLTDMWGLSEITVRRDLDRLAKKGLLKRTHGGAISAVLNQNEGVSGVKEKNKDIPDVLIFSPTPSRKAKTLIEHAQRAKIGLISESDPIQTEVPNFGVDDYNHSLELGTWAAKLLKQNKVKIANVLVFSQEDLGNVKLRRKGFIEGLKSNFKQKIKITIIDSITVYSRIYQIASDTLQVHPETNVIFGINDDTTLAAIQAYKDLGLDPEKLHAFNTGGEGNTIFDELNSNGPLKATIAFFPFLFGKILIDAASHILSGNVIRNNIFTPYRLLTLENLNQYYTKKSNKWSLIPEVEDRLNTFKWEISTWKKGKNVNFLTYFKSHEWYENISKAMQKRAQERNINFKVVDFDDHMDLATIDLKRMIGKKASDLVNDDETIIIDSGQSAEYLVQFLGKNNNLKNITVITHSLDIFNQLKNFSHIRLYLVGGEFNNRNRYFFGKKAISFYEDLRADKAFIVADGISNSFGVSCNSIEQTELKQKIIQASKETIFLADHTRFDEESHYKVCELQKGNSIITDSGTSPTQRVFFTQKNIQVIVVDKISIATER